MAEKEKGKRLVKDSGNRKKNKMMKIQPANLMIKAVITIILILQEWAVLPNSVKNLSIHQEHLKFETLIIDY